MTNPLIPYAAHLPDLEKPKISNLAVSGFFKGALREMRGN